MSKNQKKIIKDFGNEWERFDQQKLDESELLKIFNDYFNIFPFQKINKQSEGFDLGAGSGRWAYFISDKVGKLNVIEPSTAINVSRNRLIKKNNINYFNEDIFNLSLKEESQDFGYSLGVLHHIENTEAALKKCNLLLKKDAPFLMYLYYSFDNRPYIYRLIWKLSNILRIIISILPNSIKNIITDIIAGIIYFPLAKLSKILNKFNFNTNNIPLNYYKDVSFYTMRTDSRDRFGTKLEKRFTKLEIKTLLDNNGFKNISFSPNSPFWVSLSYKK